MNGQPLFSIISISYQNLSGLQETVTSVREQTFSDYEHIVVDGGSLDGTSQWLERNFTGRWVSERDGGRYPAMNKGVAMASGTYVWFLHAGDVLGDARVLERVSHALRDGPDWAYGMARVVDPNKEVVGTLGFVPFKMFNFAILGFPLPHQATVMKLSMLRRLGGYAEDLPVSADQLLLLQAAEDSEPVSMADFLCDFDSTGISAGRRWWVDHWEGERNRRRLSRPVTRSRLLDTVLALSFASLRQLTRAGRNATTRSM